LDKGRKVRRPGFGHPPAKEIKKDLMLWDSDSMDERVRRAKIFWHEFGPPVDMLLFGGYEAMITLNELRDSFIIGNYCACVLLAQAFLEHSLEGHYGWIGEELSGKMGFAKLIEKVRKEGLISTELSEKLDKLRLIRNPYVHPRPFMSEGSIPLRGVEDKKTFEELAEDDAKFAIETVVDFMREEGHGKSFYTDVHEKD